jgi:excinuclease ABC subunit C
VVFQEGRAKRSEYRHYKIRSTTDGRPDDFLSLREVIYRRFRKVREEDGPWPDLVVIDGGKGQLSSAVEALRANDTYGRFVVIGLAKRLEEIYFPGDTEPLFIPRTSTSLQLLQRVRNEAHRFAITFQRTQRKKKTLHTELRRIRGIGEKTARKLIKTFGSVKGVRAASEDEIASAVGRSAAKRIAQFYVGKS